MLIKWVVCYSHCFERDNGLVADAYEGLIVVWWGMYCRSMGGYLSLQGDKVKLKGRRLMKCICSAEQLAADEMDPSSESLATRDYTASVCSSQLAEGERKRDIGNIEEAESSLRESGCLNYEEARALLGRLEYQRGNIQAALHVFDGIDIAAVIPKMKPAISKRVERRRRRSTVESRLPPMSIHAVSLLFEAIFLKSKCLQILGRYKEAAQSCKVILDTIESSLPEGLPENLGSDCKLQETLNKAVETLPELWKLGGNFQEAIVSYRRALLYRWNLDSETEAKVQKEFAVFLLYGGCDASPPNLRVQMSGSFVPKNNIEEAILILLILLRKFAHSRMKWDPSIIDHLCFALSISGELKVLARQLEGLLPGIMGRKEKNYLIGLCYLGASDDLVALNLFKKILSTREDPKCVEALLLASKICAERPDYAEEGVSFACKALDNLPDKCDQLRSVANCLLGISLSTMARSSISEVDRTSKQLEALNAFELAEKFSKDKDPKIFYYLSLENADQRKLDVALAYAKEFIKFEGGSSTEGWVLIARILSAQKRYSDAETIINAALDQTGKWEEGELLRTRAKVQIAQERYKDAVETYTKLLGLLHVQYKSLEAGKKVCKGGDFDRNLEQETWHDLALFYTSLLQSRDAEACLHRSKSITSHSATMWHATGVLAEAKGLHNEALRAFHNALEVQPTHVPSLVSAAKVLMNLGNQTSPVVRSFLTEALRIDRTNHEAWINLGLVYKAEGGKKYAMEAADCFQAAAILEESSPVEPFR